MWDEAKNEGGVISRLAQIFNKSLDVDVAIGKAKYFFAGKRMSPDADDVLEEFGSKL